MSSLRVKGGVKLSGAITPQGAKNEALQVICATLLSDSDIIISTLMFKSGGTVMQLCHYNFHPISHEVKPFQPTTIYNFILLHQFDYHKLISASSAVTSSNLFSKLLLPYKPDHPITIHYYHTLIGQFNNNSARIAVY